MREFSYHMTPRIVSIDNGFRLYVDYSIDGCSRLGTHLNQSEIYVSTLISLLDQFGASNSYYFLLDLTLLSLTPLFDLQSYVVP